MARKRKSKQDAGFVLIINASSRRRSRTARFWRHFEKSLERGCPREHVDLCDYQIPFADGQFTRTRGGMEDLRKLVLKCKAMFIATPTYWYNAPAILKAFIDQLTPIEDELWDSERKLAIAVFSPEGGELGVFTSIVAPLNMMGFSLIGNGYAWCSGGRHPKDQWWKKEIEYMAKVFSAL